MQIKTELLQLLSEIGYTACFQGSIDKGQTIMEGIDAMGSSQPAVKVGVAIAKIYAGKYGDAISILKHQVLSEHPDHSTAKCFLGMALKEAGQNKEANTLFQDILKSGNDDERNIASIYLSL